MADDALPDAFSVETLPEDAPSTRRERLRESHRRPREEPAQPGRARNPDLAREDTNPLCGERIAFEMGLDAGRIHAARFRGEACMVALAAASLLTELVAGLTLDEAAALPDETLLAALQTELRPWRIGCATLPLTVLRGGIALFRREPPS